MNKKALIAIIAVVVIILVAGVTFLLLNNKTTTDKKETKKDTKEAITAQEVIKDESFNGLNFTNTTFIKENEQYTLQMDVTNPSDKEINLEEVNIVLKDKDGNELVTLLGYIGDPMKPSETRTITSAVTMDLSKVDSKTIEAKN